MEWETPRLFAFTVAHDMEVALIGGTGFVGGYLTDHLIAAGHQPRLLVRSGSEARVSQSSSCQMITGDVADSDAINQVLDGADAVIYNIGILREFTGKGITFKELQQEAPCRIMEAAVNKGVRRFLLMSANGVKPEGTAYQRTKFLAESYLQQSDLDWTIFRPSVIYGNPQGKNEFVTQLMHDIILSPLPAPLFFDGLLPVNAGSFKLSPVHVEDVASAFVKSLENENSIGQVLALCGPEAISWKEILETIAGTLGQTKLMFPAPALGISAVARLLDGFESFPITRDQITMLMEGNTCIDNGFAPLDIHPKPFNQQALEYLIK
ncbi:MAG: NAD(P)H-binding protein [Gammaproteobacteria bacterium]|nr:NAD(P)H-binding protein [Gammaproteobacteria bacterium]